MNDKNNSVTNTLFFDTIRHLREEEEIILYDKLISFTPTEDQLVIDYLESEYQKECLELALPYPIFDPRAALWASKIIYSACQLLLYRENREEELNLILPHYPESPTPESIVSVDLCLRFLPKVIEHAKKIDPEDSMIVILEKIINVWHYSGISGDTNPELQDYSSINIEQQNFLMQLYTDRIIKYKNKKLAKHPLFSSSVKAALGNYSNIFWNDLL